VGKTIKAKFLKRCY